MMNRPGVRIRELCYTALAAMVFSVTACGDGSTGPGGSGTAEGNYTLSTVDAKPLPYMMYSDTGYTLEVMSGSLAINVGGKWVAKFVQRETVAGNVSTYSDSTFGTWTLSSASQTVTLFNTETSVSASATWTASDITVTEVDGTVTRKIVYRRD